MRVWVGCGSVRLVAAVGVLAGLAACTAPAEGPQEPAPAPPPAPPAACLLDPGRLAAVTGLQWAADQSTASDTRCVYDPSGPAPSQPTPAAPADGSDFLIVEIAPTAADDAQTELDTVAAACADGSRAPIRPDGQGFVCRFRGGSVLAADVRAGQLVTVSASGVPAGTTAARMVLALQQQLDTLGR